MGLPSDEGPLTVVAADCAHGGVGWANPLLAFGAGGRFYALTELDDVDWRSVGLGYVDRSNLRSLALDGDELRVRTTVFEGNEGGCCPLGNAYVWLKAQGHKLVPTRI